MKNIFNETIGDETFRVSLGNYGQERDLVLPKKKELFSVLYRVYVKKTISMLLPFV